MVWLLGDALEGEAMCVLFFSTGGLFRPMLVASDCKHGHGIKLEEKKWMEGGLCQLWGPLFIRRADVFPEATSLSRLMFLSGASSLGHLSASASSKEDHGSEG